MMSIPCPHCGPRNQEEFAFQRSADGVVRLEDAPDVAMAALYTRTNPKGSERELWVHLHGCGEWLWLTRDRLTHAISDVVAA